VLPSGPFPSPAEPAMVRIRITSGQRPSVTRLPLPPPANRLRLGPDPLPAGPVTIRGSRLSSGRAVGGSGPATSSGKPAEARSPLHGEQQGHSRSGSKVRASRWYEHQEALEVRRLGDAPLDRTGSPTPPSPSPGRRRELPRSVDLHSCLVPDLRTSWPFGPAAAVKPISKVKSCLPNCFEMVAVLSHTHRNDCVFFTLSALTELY
jgi:hypothetical protein